MDASSCKEAVCSAKAAALAAGKIIMAAIKSQENSRLQVKSGVDLVTETDKAAEMAIIDLLKASHPGHKFIGEESTFDARGATGDAFEASPTWVIDPLDGTTNFVHGYPLFCVSIALVVERVPVVGVVYHPVSGDMYTACQGQGAFLNGTKIEVRAAQGLGDALVVNNIGAGRDESFIAITLARLGELLRRNVQAVRMSGSAALNMCHVACGKLDCYYEDGYGGPWDVAAGFVIVTEAGGVVRGLRDEEFVLKPGKGKVVCGNERVVAEVCDALAAADGICNGIANGIANGKANGIANGKANGIANGKANGIANGKANGIANGKANVIANGKANGIANGIANGHANGNANGHVEH